MTQNETAPYRPVLRRYLFLIAAAVVIVSAAIYVTERLAGNGQDGATSPLTQKMLDTIKPLATGEIAALAVADQAKPIPAIGFADADGGPKSLRDWRGRLVLLNLWATWCAPCLREMPTLDRLQARLGSDRFEVVAINVDKGGPEKGQNFYRKMDLQNLGYFYDNSAEKIFRQIRAFGMPTTMLVDENGLELARMAGPAEWDSQDAVALLEAALAIR